MCKDEIIAELRKYREEHAAKFNYDSEKIYRDLKDKEIQNKGKKVTLKSKVYVKPDAQVLY